MHFFAPKRISHLYNMQFAHSTIFHPSAPKRGIQGVVSESVVSVLF
jgi:hypothetical protein